MSRIRIEEPSSVVFVSEHVVRVTDLNYGRHLGHEELIGLLHQARVEFLGSLGFSELDLEGAVLIVVDLAVHYRAEAFLGDRLSIEIGVAGEGRRGIRFVYAVRRKADGVLVATATTGVVFADRTSRSVVAIPTRFRLFVEEEAV